MAVMPHFLAQPEPSASSGLHKENTRVEQLGCAFIYLFFPEILANDCLSHAKQERTSIKTCKMASVTWKNIPEVLLRNPACFLSILDDTRIEVI